MQASSRAAIPHAEIAVGKSILTRWQRVPAVPLALSLALFALAQIPRIASNPRLEWTFVGVAGALLAWALGLWATAATRARTFKIEFTPIRSHWVQACVQSSIYAYWGWYWRPVYDHLPLILGQILFLYAVDGLLSWSRGRTWRLGFGPLPIIFSTNLFMWFKDDVFYWQFLMVLTGALGKEFVRWTRHGKKVHIFNPSAFGLGLFSMVLIATNNTHQTWGIEIASTLQNPPHIYLEIFLIGLVVQYFFHVTLMTLSAVAALVVSNLVYTRITGVYMFLDTNIPIAVFLGLHLLVTDPSTSPRTNVGRVIFGALYGFANFALYEVLMNAGIPEFYDKLLPVPILNLLVPAIEWISGVGLLAKFTQWESRFSPKKLNLVHMGTWIALFFTLLGSGFVEAPIPGSTIAFWKHAWDEGKPHGGDKYLKLVQARAAADEPFALNELGVVYMEGKLLPQNRAAAAHYFSRACEQGDGRGCMNVARQFLTLREARSDADVARALDRLEHDCTAQPDPRACYFVALAYETGHGRAKDEVRARALYQSSAERANLDAAKALARIATATHDATAASPAVLATLERGCAVNDAESCWYLAGLLRGGLGAKRDDARAGALTQQACTLGYRPACDAQASAQR